jgi:hypothetical protein
MLPILLIWSWKRLQSSYANYKAFRRQVAPPAIATVAPPRSNYVPKSTAALAVMKQVPNPVTAQEASSTWVHAQPNPPATNGRRIPANGKSIYDEGDLSQGHPQVSRLQNDSVHPVSLMLSVNDIESTLADPSATTVDEAKEEMQ